MLQSMADWLAAAIGGRARRLAAAARASRSDRREGPPAGRKQQSAGESRRVADGDGFKFQNVRCVRECVGGVTEWEG